MTQTTRQTLETQIEEITARIDNLKASGDPAYGLKKERRVFYVQAEAIATADRRIAEQAFADAWNAKEAAKVRREFWITDETGSRGGIVRHGSATGIPFKTFRAAKRNADRFNFQQSRRDEGLKVGETPAVIVEHCWVGEFAHGELVKVTK